MFDRMLTRVLRLWTMVCSNLRSFVWGKLLRDIFRWIVIFAVASFGVGCQRFLSPLIAPKRLTANPFSIVISESISLERSPSGTSITLSFDTKTAAECKFGFFATGSDVKAPSNLTSCSGKSTTKFSETLNNVPKDQLVTILLKAWPAAGAEPSTGSITIAEVPPTADAQSINMLFADLGGRWSELTAISDSRTPSELLSEQVKLPSSACALSDGRDLGFVGTRKSSLIQSASFRGLFNATTSRISPSILGASFNIAQRQSAEWSVTAKTASGFGQLRLARPVLLLNPVFTGIEQSQGLMDDLDDTDPPAIKLQGTNTLVATWSVEGDSTNARTTLTIQRSPGFPGIVCVASAASGRIVVPAELVAKIPAAARLWTTLRLDSWQSLDKERWLVRVSDWSSMGVQRL